MDKLIDGQMKGKKNKGGRKINTEIGVKSFRS
jgi:hypothetical protein